MATGISDLGLQQIDAAPGSLLSFSLATDAAMRGLTNERLGRWYLYVEILDPFLNYPFVCVASGDLFGGGTAYTPQVPSTLTVSNWKLIVDWFISGLTWTTTLNIASGTAGLQGPPGPPGAPGGFKFANYVHQSSGSLTVAGGNVYHIEGNVTMTFPTGSVGDVLLLWMATGTATLAGATVAWSQGGNFSTLASTKTYLIFWDSTYSRWIASIVAS